MNDRVRVMIQLEDGQKEKIENCIKESYPKLRNPSEVIRQAIDDFLWQAAAEMAAMSMPQEVP